MGTFYVRFSGPPLPAGTEAALRAADARVVGQTRSGFAELGPAYGYTVKIETANPETAISVVGRLLDDYPHQRINVRPN